MRTLVIVLSLAPLILVAEAGEDEDLFAACRGTISGLLRDLRQGDESARTEAVRVLKERGRFTLAYVLAAAEGTTDEEYRTRLWSVADAILADVRDEGFGYATFTAEYPGRESVASGTFRDLIRGESLLADPLPVSLHTVRNLTRARRHREAVETLVAFAAAHPDRLAEALDLAGYSWIQEDDDCARPLKALESLADRAARTLPRPEKAWIEFELANWYSHGREKRLKAMAKKYSDTPAGLLAEYELLRGSGEPLIRRVKRLEEFSEKHPGTEAARRALEEVAFHFSNSNLAHIVKDPLARLRRVATVAARLQSGEFPGPEAHAAAVKYLNEFYMDRDDLSEASARIMLPAYRVFFRNHFLYDRLAPDAAVMHYTLPSKLHDLHRALGVPEDEIDAVIDQELEALDEALPEKAAIRYFRAVRPDSVVGLVPVVKDFADRLYGRQALLARAGILYVEDYLDWAEKLYAKYTKDYPASGAAWLAALRVGHCRFHRGELAEAIKAYQVAGAAFPADHLMLRVLVPVSLGRCYEESGRLKKAVAAYRKAVAAWPEDGGQGLATSPMGASSRERVGIDPDATVYREEVRRRAEVLDRPRVPTADMKRFVRGEKLRDRGSEDKAIEIWTKLVEERPDSPVAEDAREGIAGICLNRAVIAASRREGEPDEAEALRAVAEAKKAGGRFGRIGAAFVHAALLLREEKDEKAVSLLAGALETWASTQAYRTPEEGIEATAARIRHAAFQPDDERYSVGEKYRRGSRPYLVLSSTIGVQEAGGATRLVDVPSRLERFPCTLYFTPDQLAFLERAIDALGRKKRKKGVRRERYPGDALAIAGLLDRFFPVRRAHWHGWHLQSYPILGLVVIPVRGGKAATVKFRVGYRGGDLRVIRQRDHWMLQDVDFKWIE